MTLFHAFYICFHYFLLQANDCDDDDDDNDGCNGARQNTKNLMKQHKGISKYFS